MKKIHRFIIPGIQLEKTTRVSSREIAHQLKTVLKIAVGEQIIFCNGAGDEALGTLVSIDGSEVTIDSCEIARAKGEAPHEVTVYAAIVKRDNFELLAQKVVEVGATAIVPIITQRTIKTAINAQRIQTIVREAAEQAGRGILPHVLEPMDVKTALQTAKGAKFICQMDGAPFQAIPPIGDATPRSVFIGPEGGWENSELQFAKEVGVVPVSFSPLVFRAETAAIIAAHLLVTSK